jgi:hypothetical protein
MKQFTAEAEDLPQRQRDTERKRGLHQTDISLSPLCVSLPLWQILCLGGELPLLSER